MKEKLKVYLPGIAFAIIAVVFAWQYVEPAPPDSIRLAVGPEGSSYAWLGERYKEILKKEGLSVELIATQGSLDNLELIKSNKADIGFVQSGVTLGKEDKTPFFFLASLYLEPLWIFFKGDDERSDLLKIKDQVFAVGVDGSGSHFVANALINALNENDTNELVPDNSPELLIDGEADILFLLASPNSPQVHELLGNPKTELMDFRRAEGVAKHFDSLSHLTLSEGAVNVAENWPDQDTRMLASAATLVVGENFHPALTSVILSAAQEIHNQPGPLQARGDFPSQEYGTFPMTREAAFFHKNGPGFLQGKLPYKAAATLQRLIIMLLPLLTIVLPLAKILPAIYSWRLNRRLHTPYKELLALENRVGEDDFLERLEKVEKQAKKLVDMPASYGAQIQNLLHHIERLKRRHKVS